MSKKYFGHSEEELLKMIEEIRQEKEKNIPIRETSEDFFEIVKRGSDLLLEEHQEELKEIFS